MTIVKPDGSPAEPVIRVLVEWRPRSQQIHMDTNGVPLVVGALALCEALKTLFSASMQDDPDCSPIVSPGKGPS